MPLLYIIFNPIVAEFNAILSNGALVNPPPHQEDRPNSEYSL